MTGRLQGRRTFLSVLFSSAVGLHALGDETTASSLLFHFHSGFWLNLHLTLYAQSSPAGKSGAPVPSEPNWQSALSFYKANLTSRDLTFDEGMTQRKNDLEDQEDAPHLSPTANLSSELIAVLQDVVPFYRSTMWRKADDANRRWIATITPLVNQYGTHLSGELSRVYQSPWPADAVRADVVNYANWAGAFTTLHPTRITISSIDERNQDHAALEILFHEASHGIVHKLRRALDAECRKQRVRLSRPDLWHALLFYTTGEAVRRVIPNYVPYAEANGLWKSSWSMYINSIKRDWQPYLDGRISFEAAISDIVKDVGQPNNATA